MSLFTRTGFGALCGMFLACGSALAQCAPSAISSGQTVTGTLSSNCASTRRAGSYARLYTFTAGVNASIVVTMSSPAFDSFVYLVRPDGLAVSWTSGTRGGILAQVRHTATAAGTYTIEATSSVGGATGGFEVNLTLVAAGAPVIANGGIVNGASFRAGIASGSWVTIRGSDLAASSRAWSPADFQGNGLPRSLDGVSVNVNGRDAAVYFVSPTQINALAPADTAAGTVTVTVTNPRGASVPVTAMLQRFSPAWFAFSQQNGVYPAAVHTDGTYVGPTDLFGGAAVAIPARPQETILLFGTGFGPTNPAVDPMTVFSGAAPLEAGNDLRITIGGRSATAQFAGLVGNGLYQFNVVVPDLPDGEHSLMAIIGGLSSQTLRLAVRTPPPVPAITRMSPNDLIWGQTAVIQLTGTGMAGVTAVEFSDPSELRVTGKISSTSTSVSFALAVDGDARPGERTLQLVHPNGRSNTIPFTVRAGNPTITSFSLPVVYPDRVYPPIGGMYSSARAQFRIRGTDLAGVKAVVITPDGGVGVRGTLIAFTQDVYSEFFVDADAPTGQRQISVTSPAGASNSLPFEIQRAPATVPTISNVTLEAPTLSGHNITYRGSITFTDADGDIKPCPGPSGVFCTGGAFIRVMPLSSDLGAMVDLTGIFLNLTGRTSGRIDFTCILQFSAMHMEIPSPTRVAVTLVDAADHPSNAVVVTVPSWLAPVL